MLTVLLATSPLFAYAKNNGKNGNSEKKQKIEKMEKVEKEDTEDDEDRENGSDKKCWNAYGHLFAFGWLKKNERPEIDMDCFLPFGIAKKFRGYRNTATSTLDNSAPVISNIKTSVGITGATISWNTNGKSDSGVFWSIVSPVDIASSSVPHVVLAGQTKNHQVAINGLSASTTYYAVVRSKDSSGNSATSSEFSFTTKPIVIVSDTTPPVIHSIIAVVGTSTANIGWQTNEPATAKVYYGTTTPLSKTASSTNSVESNALSLARLLLINNLSTSTTYYVLVESKDGASNIQTSSQFSFTTGM